MNSKVTSNSNVIAKCDLRSTVSNVHSNARSLVSNVHDTSFVGKEGISTIVVKLHVLTRTNLELDVIWRSQSVTGFVPKQVSARCCTEHLDIYTSVINTECSSTINLESAIDIYSVKVSNSINVDVTGEISRCSIEFTRDGDVASTSDVSASIKDHSLACSSSTGGYRIKDSKLGSRKSRAVDCEACVT